MRDGFIGMLVSGIEKCEVAPVLQIGYGDQVIKLKIDNETIFRDDLTGQFLDPTRERAARKKELDFFESKGVWITKAMDEARRRAVKPPITVRWVDVSKGDDVEPNIRSRLVARQIRQLGEEAIFAPSPPLHLLRTVISLASTDITGRAPHVRDTASERRTQISTIDISRAYFNASMDEKSEPTYVIVPSEHPDQFTLEECAASS